MNSLQDLEPRNLEDGYRMNTQTLLIDQLKDIGDFSTFEDITRTDGSSLYSTPTLSPSSSFASFRSCFSTFDDDEAEVESSYMDEDEPMDMDLQDRSSENGNTNPPKNDDIETGSSKCNNNGDELENDIHPALRFLQSGKQSDSWGGDYQSRISLDRINKEINTIKANNQLFFERIISDPLIWLPPNEEWEITSESERSAEIIEENKTRDGSEKDQHEALMDAIIDQFKFIVRKILAVEEISSEEESGDSWLDVVFSLSWKASKLIKPNFAQGNPMDPGLYLKIKCISCGSPSLSQVINGLVFKKNTAHRHMPSRHTNPRLLLFKGALSQEAIRLSSFDSMDQETNYSKVMVEMIDACHPDVVLVEKTVSRDILESLLERRISLVSDVKLHRLKRISLCTGSPIISSADIPISPDLKQCDLFYLEKFVEEHVGQDRRGKTQNKTLMFFEGCPKPLGCTILLNGSQSEKLKRVKRAVKSAVSAAYHLSAETAFLADQKKFFSDSHKINSFSSETSNGDSTNCKNCKNCSSPRHSEVSDTKDILVISSRQCTLKGIICEPSHLSRIEYYHRADVPLGKFLQGLLLPSQGKICSSCGEMPQEHTYSFTHYNGNLTVVVRKIPSEKHLPGKAEGKIWMWITNKYGSLKSSTRIVMSGDAQDLSFGKFLELSFLSQSTYGKISAHGPLLYRDWALFFGSGSYVAVFLFSPIDVYTVCQPPQILDFADQTVKDLLEGGESAIIQDSEQLFADLSSALASVKLDNQDLKTMQREEKPITEIPSSRNLHPEIRLRSSKSELSVICLYAEEFRSLRSFYCSSERGYMASVGRCKVWDVQGGKSGAMFAKSLDGRLVIKQISHIELESFLKFAPDYFKYISSSFYSGNQTCLTKILGIYQVKRTKNGKETRTNLVVMENLLQGRSVSRVYDLKGAVFSRLVAQGDDPGRVLLDQNFMSDMIAHPIYVTGPSKRLLERAIWNDTSFLTGVGVMDYSLLIGVDEGRREMVFGIIDYLRQYTWDKKLETWVKSSWVVPKNEQPTIISPREYQKRFRKFMSRYFLTIPPA